MTTRTRPDGCCTVPNLPAPMTDDLKRDLVAVFKALGDATRLEIFRLIAAQQEPICVCDIVDRFELRQPTISHHLKVLRDAGLVTATKQGIWAYYAVNEDGLAMVRETFDLIAPAKAVTAS